MEEQLKALEARVKALEGEEAPRKAGSDAQVMKMLGSRGFKTSQEERYVCIIHDLLYIVCDYPI